MRTSLSHVVVLLCVALSSLPARAADHFLTIGGGHSPSNNQVSLEKNVLYLQRFLADRGMGDAPHEILFADGAGGARDLVYTEPTGHTPHAVELVARVLGLDDGLDDDYRPHVIPRLWGPSNRPSLNKWFDTVGKTLAEGDRLVVYYTGHGGRGSTLAMWNEDDMSAKEFATLLDKLPPKVSVVLVMVQCFSGGYANMIYDGGDPAQGLSKRDRCGFFATVSDRVAAGCTSDVDEENYREYSTYFWAALYGQTRTGQPVRPPDFDGDGKVSLAEAHGYVLVNSETIDISVKTSDALLRKYSKTKPVAGAATAPPDAAKSPDSARNALALMRVDAEAPLDDLKAAAGPTEKAVLTALAQQLDLKADAPLKSAQSQAESLLKRQRLLDRKFETARKHLDETRWSVRGTLLTRWPELSNVLHAKAAAILHDDADAIVKAVESAPRFKDFERAEDELQQCEDERMTLDRKWAKVNRFIRQTENVALAANLPDFATPEVVEKYRAIVAAEGGTLGTISPTAARASSGGIEPRSHGDTEAKRVEGVGCDPVKAK